MGFNSNVLEPSIRQILSAPGTDLTTISAKRVRRQLLEIDSSLSAEILKENKDAVDAVIASVFEAVSAEKGGVEGASGAEEEDSGKRKREDEDVYDGEEADEDRGDDDSASPPPKKTKKSKKSSELADAELARQLSSEINGRSRRSAGGKGRPAANGSPKKGGRKKKSSAMVDSDDDESGEDGTKPKSKTKKKASGNAKGGFGKEYILSEPLAAVLQVEKLSRPQVVKHLWEYIKGNELQNPSNKREIMCDGSLRAVFNVDKIDMFRMNKVLGQHLHENEG